ncbi:hypothetical protein [Caldivirga maquilingensis]|uniref:Uncharacterized protein n=1 Tax=Caldivirga maquilingensis (strain ATCC 700844 / DSM 13496 / JCM 10307 / IC-167) TaxID=397948 RepID=A8MD23_CALMQ|nr:hypothetical protein [Caldivirga maquilingensis]ABW01679.1 hypothetical protein Cmaq_0844 [Caldivirga maquilingensis IC-167]
MKGELRYSLIIALILVVMTIAVSAATPVELLFSVESRLIAPNGNLIYVVYNDNSISWVTYTPFYIYAWRFSAIMFLLWIAVIIIYVIKPLKTADVLSIILAVIFAASEYVYLYSIGAKVIMLPLAYILYTIGKPLLFIDVGQLALIYALWRAFKNNLIKIKRGGK